MIITASPLRVRLLLFHRGIEESDAALACQRGLGLCTRLQKRHPRGHTGRIDNRGIQVSAKYPFRPAHRQEDCRHMFFSRVVNCRTHEFQQLVMCKFISCTCSRGSEKCVFDGRVSQSWPTLIHAFFEEAFPLLKHSVSNQAVRACGAICPALSIPAFIGATPGDW